MNFKHACELHHDYVITLRVRFLNKPHRSIERLPGGEVSILGNLGISILDDLDPSINTDLNVVLFLPRDTPQFLTKYTHAIYL